MRDQPRSIHFKFVLLRFAAKDRMIFQDQGSFPSPGKPLKKQRGGKSADTAANHNTVINLSGIDRISQEGAVRAIAHLVPGLQHLQRISIGASVIAYAAVASPIILSGSGKNLRRSSAIQQRSPRAKKRRAKKITPRYFALVDHIEPILQLRVGAQHAAPRLAQTYAKRLRTKVTNQSYELKVRAKTYGRVSSGCLLFS